MFCGIIGSDALDGTRAKIIMYFHHLVTTDENTNLVINIMHEATSLKDQNFLLMSNQFRQASCT